MAAQNKDPHFPASFIARGIKRTKFWSEDWRCRKRKRQFRNSGECMTLAFPVLFPTGQKKVWYWIWRHLRSWFDFADREDDLNPTNWMEGAWFCDSQEYHISPGPPTSAKNICDKNQFLSGLTSAIYCYHCSQIKCWYKSEYRIWLFWKIFYFVVYHFILLLFSTLYCLWLKNN